MGEWYHTYLGDLGIFTGGGTPSKNEPAYWQGNIPWLSSSDIFDESITHISITRFITDKALENSATKLVPKDTILLVSRVGVGKLAVTAKPVCTNQGFQSLIVKETEVNLFWYYWIILHKHELIRRSSGSTFKEIGKNKIKTISTFSPNKKEQQKIAACLASLDHLISAATGRLDALRQHKKGLMQQLFPAVGETMPRLRFPEFRNAGEWEENGILDIATMKARIGWQNLRKEEYLNDGHFFLVTGTDFKDNKVDWKSTKFVSYSRYIQDKNIILREGDILITKDGSIGKVAYVENLKNRKSTLK